MALAFSRCRRPPCLRNAPDAHALNAFHLCGHVVTPTCSSDSFISPPGGIATLSAALVGVTALENESDSRPFRAFQCFSYKCQEASDSMSSFALSNIVVIRKPLKTKKRR